MTKFKTSDLLDDAALEIVAGGMIRQPTIPGFPPSTGPTFPDNPFPFPIPFGPWNRY
jgi:hypothetical protein